MAAMADKDVAGVVAALARSETLADARVVATAVEAGRGRSRGRRLGRLRLQAVPDASARSLEGFLDRNLAKPAAVTTDGWKGYAGLDAKGFEHEAINLNRSWGEASLRLPAIHLVFGLAKRWLLGTHHGTVNLGRDGLPASGKAVTGSA